MARHMTGMAEGGIEPRNVDLAMKDAANTLKTLVGPAVAFCNSEISSKRSVLFFKVASYADPSSSCTLAKIFAFHLV